MKVALVYDRVNKWGGAERVLLALHELFPDAPLYTSVYNQKTAIWADVFPKVIPSFLQKIPYAKTHHEYLAPFMPFAFESFDFSHYDLVISVTSESAKGIITPPHVKHICYCLTPTRYLWSGYKDYFDRKIFKAVSKPAVNYLRKWDRVAAHRPDVMVGISREVCNRIKRYYGRQSDLIHPPVDTSKIHLRTKDETIDTHDKYYLLVSRLVSYKKVDLAIRVFNQLKYPLMVIGKGKELSNLRKIAGSTISFRSDLTDSELHDYYGEAKALIFPQVEDFGLVSVEAQSAGTPVIAYKKGGALDTVIDGETGVFFEKQNEESLAHAIKTFESLKFSRGKIRSHSLKFSKKRFLRNFQKIINNV